MIRNEICRTLNYVDKNFNDLDKVIQAKIALERLEVVDTKLFDRKRFIVSETYKLSDRQEAIMKNLKKIFKKGFLVDLESEDKKDANVKKVKPINKNGVYCHAPKYSFVTYILKKGFKYQTINSN